MSATQGIRPRPGLAQLALLGMLILLAAGCGQRTATWTDTVSVDYVARLEDGSLHDTSIASVAIAEGMFDDEKLYAPLLFKIGEQTVLPGFEEAVVGMAPGQTKTAAIENAYGPYSAMRVSNAPLAQRTDRYLEVSRDAGIPISVFERDFTAGIGDRVDVQGVAYTVVNRSATDYILRREAGIGDTVELPELDWPATVVNMTDSLLLLRQDPVPGSMVRTPLGPATVTADDTAITLTLFLVPGATVQSELGRGEVTAINGTHATIDFNHPLAGETVVFTIILHEIKG